MNANKCYKVTAGVVDTSMAMRVAKVWGRLTWVDESQKDNSELGYHMHTYEELPVPIGWIKVC